MEMTGLDNDNDHILEIAIVVTDQYADRIFEKTTLYIKHDDDVYENATQWAKENLVDIAYKSKNIGVTYEEASEKLTKFFEKYVHVRKRNSSYIRRVILCGSTVSTDRRILLKYFPHLEKWISHKTIDVSGLMEIIKLVRPNIIKFQPRNTGNHTAMSDILSSINLYKYYVQAIFNDY